MADWINAHPLKNNAESPLWIMLDKKNFGKAITYQAANKQLKRKGEEANLGKRIFLNLFRHSEATRAATWLTDNEMRIRHGWTSDSKMASRYTHLTQSDLDKKILQHHGIIEEEKKDIL